MRSRIATNDTCHGQPAPAGDAGIVGTESFGNEHFTRFEPCMTTILD